MCKSFSNFSVLSHPSDQFTNRKHDLTYHNIVYSIPKNITETTLRYHARGTYIEFIDGGIKHESVFEHTFEQNRYL